MPVTNHDLHIDFPDMSEKITELKTHDRHFARLYDEYNELDKEVRKVEQDVTPSSDERLDGLRMKRVQLKDELYAMLQK